MTLDSLEKAQAAAKKRSNNSEYLFAVVLKENNKVIGEIEACPRRKNRDTFSLCWMLNTDYQGKGYAFEVAQAFFHYLFSKGKARRIYAYTKEDNVSSQTAVQKTWYAQRRFLPGIYKGMGKQMISYLLNSHRLIKQPSFLSISLSVASVKLRQFHQIPYQRYLNIVEYDKNRGISL